MITKSILVVDDEIAVLNATTKGLRLSGHHVEGAQNSDEALKLCTSQSFDVVILDFMMPGVNGLELLAMLRKVQPTVRAIIISGKIAESRSEEDLSAQLREQVEADAYLHKPLTVEKIIAAIEQVSGDSGPANWKTMAAEMTRPSRTSLVAAENATASLTRKNEHQ